MIARTIILLLLLAIAGVSVADDQRAHLNYMLHCQGCHLAHGEGVPGTVPQMKDFVGYFLHSQQGRDFLIRVPGVSRSALNADEIAELMNWYLLAHSAEQLPDPFTPFTPAEVAELRKDPEGDPDTARARILTDIAGDLPSLQLALSQE